VLQKLLAYVPLNPAGYKSNDSSSDGDSSSRHQQKQQQKQQQQRRVGMDVQYRSKLLARHAPAATKVFPK